MNNEIIKVDWAVFNYLHSDNVEDAFQKLTEQLFCYEFGRPFGVYRFYNQRYIETEPIHVGTDVIGFQSKYYASSAKFAEKAKDFIEVIENIQSKHSDITKIIFYTNIEPTESTIQGKSKPKYIDDIELRAQKRGITVDWRSPNQIETMLIRPELYYIRDYFFATNSGIRKTIDQILYHSKNILNSIDTNIIYHEESIHIQYEPINISGFLNSEEHILLVYGKSGCGKSALVKSLFEKEQDSPFFVFRASDFDISSVPEFTRKFGDYTWEDILSIFDSLENKICLIDSAEKALTINNNETFKSILLLLKNHGWHIIFTLREEYYTSFVNSYLHKDTYIIRKIDGLPQRKFDQLHKKYQFALPNNDKLKDLLHIPFYLKLYLSDDRFSSSSNPVDFFEHIWNRIICNDSQQKNSINIRRGNTIVKMVDTNIRKGISYYIPEDNDDWEAISLLQNDGIIFKDLTFDGFFFYHDVYEEIVLIHKINQEYIQNETVTDFFFKIGDSITVRKTFRLWLHIQFETDSAEINHFFENIFQNEDFLVWKDEILIALFSEENMIFAPFLDRILKENDYALLFRSLHLLNTACKTIDYKFLEGLLTSEEMQTYNIYKFNIPLGHGWNYLITYAYKHREHIPWTEKNINKIINVLYTWSQKFNNGETTRNAGLLALYIYDIANNKTHQLFLEKEEFDNLRKTILFCSKEILSELSEIINDVIIDHETGCRNSYTSLCDFALGNVFTAGTLCEAAPDLLIRLAKCFWIKKESDYSEWHSFLNLESDFGLNSDISLKYYPSSAFQTPVLALLNSNPNKGIDFIVEFFNFITSEYCKSELKDECFEIELSLSEEKNVKQIASGRLWGIHRGTSSAPNLLECILMALERWLYQLFEHCSQNLALEICTRLLSKSSSVAITAVIVNMVNAYPNKLFDIACTFLHTPIISIFDLDRLVYDSSPHIFLGGFPKDEIFDNERSNSEQLPFRKKCLERTILDYQFNNFDLSQEEFDHRKVILYKAIDKVFASEEKLSDEERFSLYRMDARKMRMNPIQVEMGSEAFELQPILPSDLAKKQQESINLSKGKNKYYDLWLWADSRYSKDNDKYINYPQYESNPSLALNDAISSISDETLPFYLKESISITVVSVLLIDFSDRLTQEEVLECREAILFLCKNFLENNVSYDNENKMGPAISALPCLFSEGIINNVSEEPKALLVMFAFLPNKLQECAISIIREKVWSRNEMLALSLISLYIKLKPGYDEKVLIHKQSSTIDFFENNKSIILTTLQQPFCSLPDVTGLNYEQLLALNLFYPNDSNQFSIDVLFSSGNTIWNSLFHNDRKRFQKNDRKNFYLEQLYISWLAGFLLNSTPEIQEQIIQRLSYYIDISDNTNYLLLSIIKIQDHVRNNSSFWNIWDSLLDIIKKLSESERENVIRISSSSKDYLHSTFDSVLSTYLFAMPYWSKRVRSWHTLEEKDSHFFYKAVDLFGYHPITIFSISRVLNTVGYMYIKDGVNWLSRIISDNKHLQSCALQIDTEYYMEEYMQRFINFYGDELKRNKTQKANVIIILNYLVDRGSTIGFMLREKIS